MLSRSPAPAIIHPIKSGRKCLTCGAKTTNQWIEATLKKTREAGLPRPSVESVVNTLLKLAPEDWYIPAVTPLRQHFRRGESPEWNAWDEQS